jgi:hypothetical protein
MDKQRLLIVGKIKILAFIADEFWFIVIEKTEPFDVGIYMSSESFMEVGRTKYKELLNLYDTYFIKQDREINDYYVESIL